MVNQNSVKFNRINKEFQQLKTDRRLKKVLSDAEKQEKARKAAKKLKVGENAVPWPLDGDYDTYMDEVVLHAQRANQIKEEKNLTLEVGSIYDRAFKETSKDANATGLGPEGREKVCELLQAKLNLNKNTASAASQLWYEGDKDGDNMIDKQELVHWAIDKRREIYGNFLDEDKAETEEEVIARVSELFDKFDVDKSGGLRGGERVDIVKALQQELNLAKNPWAASSKLRIEADKDGDNVIDKQELIDWVLSKKRESK